MSAFHAAEADVLDGASEILHLVVVLHDGLQWRACIVEVLVDLTSGVGTAFVVTSLLVRNEYTHVSDHLFGLGESGILEVENTVLFVTILHQSNDLWIDLVAAHVKLRAVDSEVLIRHG